MAALEISHSYADGTQLHGTDRAMTARGTAVRGVLRAHGWRWGPSIGAWHLRGSRDQLHSPRVVDATAAALRALGHAVAVAVDDTPRPMAQQEADRAARQTGRAAALTGKAQRRRDAADAAGDAADAIAGRIPLGQPLLVGHHSEPRHRRDLARIDRLTGRSAELAREADEADRRAQAAAAHMGARENPVTVVDRIRDLEAAARRIARTLDQPAAASDVWLERMRASAADVDNRLAHWRDVRAQQIADGTAADYTRADVYPGDWISDYTGSWWRAVRVNRTTVVVATSRSAVDDTWRTGSLLLAHVRQVLRPDDYARMLAGGQLAAAGAR